MPFIDVTIFFFLNICRATSSADAGGQTLNQLLLPAPPTPSGSAAPVKADPKIDLLSGDDFSSPKAENSLALVAVGEQPSTSPVPQQNALVLFDMFSSSAVNSNNTQPTTVAGQTLSPQFQHHQQQTFVSPQGGFYTNGSAPNMGSPRYEQSPYLQGTGPAWNGQIAQQQQPHSPVYGKLNPSFVPLVLDNMYLSGPSFCKSNDEC